MSDKQGWVSTENEDFVKEVYAGIFDENNIKELKRFIAASKQIFDTHEEDGVQWVALKGKHKAFNNKPSFWQRVKNFFTQEEEEAQEKAPAATPRHEEQKNTPVPPAHRAQPKEKTAQKPLRKQTERKPSQDRNKERPRQVQNARKEQGAQAASDVTISQQAIERGTLRIDMKAKQSAELLKLCNEECFTSGERRHGAYVNIKRFINEMLIIQLRQKNGVIHGEEELFDSSLRTEAGEPIYIVVGIKDVRKLNVLRFVVGAEQVTAQGFPRVPVYRAIFSPKQLAPEQLLPPQDLNTIRLNSRELIKRHSGLFPDSLRAQIPVLDEIGQISEDLSFRERRDKEHALRSKLLSDKEAMVLMEEALNKALLISFAAWKDSPYSVCYGYNSKWQKVVALIPFYFEETEAPTAVLVLSIEDNFAQLYTLSEAQLMIRLLGHSKNTSRL